MPDYDSIPTAGQHRGPDQSGYEGTEVRADPPRDATAQQDEATYQLIHAEDQSHYRLRRWEEGLTTDEGYRELGRYRQQDLQAALGELSGETRFVVFENTKTGAVQIEAQRNVSANWTDGGRFDQVILFNDEAAAAEYAASRQG